MARIKLSGIQIPTVSKLNIDGELTLDAQAGTSGQVLTSAGSGVTPTWSTVSGITSGSQTFAGEKTFSSPIISSHTGTWSSANITLQGTEPNIRFTESGQPDANIGTNNGNFYILGDTDSSGVYDTIPFSVNLTSGDTSVYGVLTAGNTSLGGAYQLGVFGTQAGVKLTNSNDSGISWIDFADSSAVRGNITYNHANETLNFGTFSGSLGDRVSITSTGLETKASTAQYPVSLNLLESSHATSRRTAISLGSQWQIGADSAGNGTRDFFLYGNGAQRLSISTAGVVTTPGALVLRSGTATANTAPLYFGTSSPAVLTTPVSGAVEYDGIAFYKTPTSTTGRAVDVASYYYVSNGTYSVDHSGSASAKPIFGSATTGLTLVAGTTYEFELNVYTSISAFIGTTPAYSHSFVKLSGTATPTYYQEIITSTNTTSLATSSTMSRLRNINNATVTVLAATASGSRHAIYNSKGIVRVTGSGTAEIAPAITASTTHADYAFNAAAGSYIKITPIGNGTVTSVGNAWA